MEKAQGNLILRENLIAFAEELEKNGIDVKTMPSPAALAVLDMAYNLGVSKLINTFPKFIGHIRARKWKAASQECKRGGISEARNDATKKLLLMAREK
jgi:GH24 family phage-related lysozyme (muramidase)